MSEPAKAVFYDDPTSLLNRQLEQEPTATAHELDVSEFFDIESTSSWILKNGFKRVGLQFPDNLLQYSTAVYGLLQSRTAASPMPPVFSILADTAFGQCCVDEVAAEHFSADCIVHFGPACLSATQRLPVKYVFGHGELDIDALVDAVAERFSSSSDKVCVFYDVLYHHVIPLVETRLKAKLAGTLVVARVNLGTDVASDEPTLVEMSSPEIKFCGRSCRVPNGAENLEGFSIIYIGEESRTLTNIMMTFNQCPVLLYSASHSSLVEQTVSSNKMLMRRFYLIERAKDAGIIGILVGTLAVDRYIEMIEHLQNIISRAGKTYYTFVIGKLNVPKLANFQEVDMFVIVACPENSILESKDFFKPVITPFELEIALVPGKHWNNKYAVEFQNVLDAKDVKDESAEASDDDADARVSLVSRSIKVNHKLLADEIAAQTTGDSAGSAVAIRNQNTAVMKLEAPSALDFFLQRSYQGLQQMIGETPVVEAVVGRAGLPVEYSGELSSEPVNNVEDDLEDMIEEENA